MTLEEIVKSEVADSVSKIYIPKTSCILHKLEDFLKLNGYVLEPNNPYTTHYLYKRV